MKVLIVGAGLLGVTSAYYLRRSGCEVTVLERKDGAALETSFANGALLTPSMPEPWNAPGCWRVLLRSLARSDAAMQLRLKALPKLMSWGMAFLRNANEDQYERSTLSNLHLALRSLELMSALRAETGIEYGRLSRGTLRIFRDRQSLELAEKAADKLGRHGLEFKRLSRAEVISLEPALSPIAEELAGALHYEGDETGDAHTFCVRLARIAAEMGVQFHFCSTVRAIECRSDRIAAVVCNRNRLVADRYVMAAGSYSGPLLQSIGVHLPIQPVKGYSVTLKRGSSGSGLEIPVIDDALHAGVVPLGDRIRVVGTAEFAGFDLALRPERIQNLMRLLREVIPVEPLNLESAQAWCGLRPMSADGVPIVSDTPLSNLFVNTGHGHLGWTLAVASGQMLAELVTGRTPSFDPRAYALSRFARGYARRR